MALLDACQRGELVLAEPADAAARPGPCGEPGADRGGGGVTGGVPEAALSAVKWLASEARGFPDS